MAPSAGASHCSSCAHRILVEKRECIIAVVSRCGALWWRAALVDLRAKGRFASKVKQLRRCRYCSKARWVPFWRRITLHVLHALSAW